MKKFLALLLALVMMLGMTATTALATDPVTVTIIVAGTLGDRSFYDSAKAGVDDMTANLTNVICNPVIECKEDPTQYEIAVVSAAEISDIVVCVGYQFQDTLTNVVPQLPDTKFVWIDNGLEGVGDNMMSIVYAQNEGSFLVGYVAGKLSKTGKVGAVGGMEDPTIEDFLVGYKAGAIYAGIAEENVMFRYAGSFEDPAKGKECALAIYDLGGDIVFQVAGKTGEGVFEAAAEKGAYAIGVDGDQKYINPDVILCSMIKNVGKSIYVMVENYAADPASFKGGQIWTADMASGFIDVGYGDATMTQQVSDELKAEVEEIAAKIVAGEIEVPTTR